MLYKASGEGLYESVMNMLVSRAMTGSEHISKLLVPAHMCNGFVLLLKQNPRWDTLLVFYPITSETQKLPEPHPTGSQYRMMVAMGYVSTTKQYKAPCFVFHFSSFPFIFLIFYFNFNSNGIQKLTKNLSNTLEFKNIFKNFKDTRDYAKTMNLEHLMI